MASKCLVSLLSCFFILLTTADNESTHTSIIDSDYGSCPTWFTQVDSIWCKCEDKVVQNGLVVKCPDITMVCLNCEKRRGYNRDDLNVSIMSGFCMTHNYSTQQTLLALCPYNNHPFNGSSLFVTLPSNMSELNSFMCGNLHREGNLCNHCIKDEGPSIFRNTAGPCLKISHSALHWFYFILLEVVLPTCFFLLVVFCKISVTTGPLNSFIFFCQVFSCLIVLQRNAFAGIFNLHTWNSSAEGLRIVVIETIGTFYTFWYNQYLWSISFSVSSNITGLQVVALEYFSAFYPFFLITLSMIIIQLHSCGYNMFCCLWMPIVRCKHRFGIDWNPMNSIIHAFATFILLGYTKVINVSFNLLAPSRVYNQSGELDYKIMSYDASVHFLSQQHLPYVVLALTVLTTFGVLPVLVLCLFPMSCFQQLLNKLNLNCSLRNRLHFYTNCYTGCYVDPTDLGRRLDCRYFAALYFIFRLAYFSCLFFVEYSYVWLALILLPLFISLLFAVMQPYRKKWLNVLDSTGFMLATASTVMYCYNTHIAEISLWIPNTFIAVPFLYFMSFVMYKVIMKVRSCCYRFHTRYGDGREEDILERAETRQLLINRVSS